jgi:hypothetical protein
VTERTRVINSEPHRAEANVTSWWDPLGSTECWVAASQDARWRLPSDRPVLRFVSAWLVCEINGRCYAENRILKAQLKGRLRLSDGERANLREIGHRLAARRGATVALPDTILAWYQRLVARKFDGSQARRARGWPLIDREIEELIVRMANENRASGFDRIVGALVVVSDQTVARARSSGADSHARPCRGR